MAGLVLCAGAERVGVGSAGAGARRSVSDDRGVGRQGRCCRTGKGAVVVAKPVGAGCVVALEEGVV